MSRTRRLAALGIGLLGILAGCASLPDNAVQETLEEATGTSLTRLAKPVELTAVDPRGPNADPFAYVAPFETNRMGQRRAFLWIAVPDERGNGRTPTLSIAGQPLALAAPIELQSAGLRVAPYARPAPWSAEFVFELDAAALRALAARGEWRIEQPRQGAASVPFTGVPVPDGLLRSFLESTGSNAD